VLFYDARDVKQLRISIVSENTVISPRRQAVAYVQVNTYSIFHDLKYQSTSLPPLVPERMLDTTSQFGSIWFKHESAEEFIVQWHYSAPDQIRCSISPCLNRQCKGTIDAQPDPDMNSDFESIDKYLITPHMNLGISRTIVLKGPEMKSLEVWISMSREMFIGRSLLVLTVHGKVREPESDRKGKGGLIPRLLGR
jgi:hypothetical protein